MTTAKTMLRGIFAAEIRELDNDEVEVVMSTGKLARDGHILEPQGVDLSGYRKNPIILWQHSPNAPIARAEEVAVDGEKITARIRFAPAGVSEDADRIRGLVKSGIVSTVSVGFDPDWDSAEPIDPKKPNRGQRFKHWTLLECSFVSVPADPDAVVTAREHGDGSTAEAPEPKVVRAHPGGVGVMLRDLYDIGRLAWLLDCLCDAKYCAEIEAALEGDGSPVPAMIGKAMQELGAALLAMAEEEIAEALAGSDDDEDDGDGLDAEATTIILASATPELKRFRIGFHRARQAMHRDDGGDSGEMTMAAVVSRCREALAHHEGAMDHHRAAMRAHRRAADCVRGIPGAGDGNENDSQQVQTSAGTEDEGRSHKPLTVEGIAQQRRSDDVKLRRLPTRPQSA